jgi:Ca-activated chloride channel family protein
MARTLIRAAAHASLLAGLLLAAPLAQQVFRTTTDVVMLSVTTSLDGRPMGGLDQGDFRVFEDGRPQEISVFARDPLPISLSILLDTSVSMEPRLAIAQEATLGLVRRMGPLDRAQIASFSSGFNIRQQFTGDRQLLERAILTARAGGSTALYNAVYVALDEVRRQTGEGAPRRRAIVLLSDGEDNSSRLEHEDVLERAKRIDAMVFSIGLRSRDTNAEGYREHEYVLRTLAQTSGGRVFFVSEARELPAVYNQISDELANQYTIGYSSKNALRDGAWRTISVRVNRPGVVARTRTGYYGPTGKGQ